MFRNRSTATARTPMKPSSEAAGCLNKSCTPPRKRRVVQAKPILNGAKMRE